MKRSMVLSICFLALAFSFGWFISTRQTEVHAQLGRGQFHCTNGVIAGRWGYNFSGTLAGIGAARMIGTTDYNADGTFTGILTANFNGQFIPALPITGKFTVNSDCTVSSEFTDPTGAKVTTRMVIVDRGQEMYLLNSDAGSAFGGVTKRID